MEVLPKDKKQKEEKTKLLGQATVDLLPYVLGKLSSETCSLPLYSLEDTSLAHGDEKVCKHSG